MSIVLSVSEIRPVSRSGEFGSSVIGNDSFGMAMFVGVARKLKHLRLEYMSEILIKNAIF